MATTTTTRKTTKATTKARSSKKISAKDKAADEYNKSYKCMMCGTEYAEPLGKFYKTKSSMYAANDGFYPICQECLRKKFDEYVHRFDERTATIMLCHYLDVPFNFSLFDGIIHKNESFNIGMYLRSMNNQQYSGKTFVNTIIDPRDLLVTEREMEEIREEEQWMPSEHNNRRNVIDIVSYDPFEGYDENQRRFLFNNIIGYLEEDGIEDDQYKISQIIQLVNNNYQIAQIDKSISKLDPQIHTKNIKDLNDLKKKLVDSNDKIAKENSISVKNRLNQQAGQSTLTYLIKHMRELNVPEAEANYYDQLRGEGTQWAANISMKAIKENGYFDENDFKDISELQYVKIQELQSKCDDLEEANRLLLIENDKLKAGGKK